VERDLGVLVDNKLNMREQCTAAAKKPAGCWVASTRASPEEIKSLPHSTQPNLEDCVQLWSLLYKKDVDRLGSVQ